MMGMGEPLHNFDHVVTALGVMLDEEALNFSHRRVTVSTVGLVPRMKKLAETLESTILADSETMRETKAELADARVEISDLKQKLADAEKQLAEEKRKLNEAVTTRDTHLQKVAVWMDGILGILLLVASTAQCHRVCQMKELLHSNATAHSHHLHWPQSTFSGVGILACLDPE